ncbi:SEC-C metal-binding domain-containing protein [Aeromonas hydrophila]|uniref:SEC-C metal-binding domain-containing protein n=1 Tax=Aeromonas hydrophila TaxID=644 RepID=UPI00209E16B3|nr:SEC-C metal-binding domain-containing protein [Aeromonas hydrophila]MCP1268224.1 SEC-C metal-binding domain-containing protein [Aeromonas hydrophila]MCP1296723.1 SEC-C metal-binding domain-containing protein [Aeromonas hydrophila]
MSGFTDEERFLNNLGEKSFLRFWSWPNLFRDQGDSNKDGDGKEICDLTVVFENNVLLFSDKRIEFNHDKDIDIAWSRWARKAIGDSVKQIKGARRWFEKYPERIFVDKKCKHRIPVEIPKDVDIKFHNIVVCHGIEEVLSSFNNEASFMFDNSIRGAAHWNRDENTPFCIGQIFEGGFVHVFNESTIELVLKEFDTTKDFTHYLSQREELLRSDKHIRVLSESDMIQLYYENFDDEKGGRSIWPKELINTEEVLINMGGIQRLYKNPSFRSKKQEDEISYFWDDLIESFSFHILNGSAEYTNYEQPIEAEPSVRFMAATSRFERRILANSFKEFYEKAIPGQRGTRLCFDPANQENAYVFCLVPHHHSFPSLEYYREVRRGMVQDYCAINKHLNREIKSIFGIACKTREEGQKLSPEFFNEGQDFVFVYGDDWQDSDYLDAKTIHDEYVARGLLVDRSVHMATISEFPERDSRLRMNFDFKGKDRNSPCICGSGKKIKKCCGRS